MARKAERISVSNGLGAVSAVHGLACCADSDGDFVLFLQIHGNLHKPALIL